MSNASPTPPDDAIEADALAAYGAYLEAFNAGDAERAARFYATPYTVVRPHGVQVLERFEDVRDMLSRSREVLRGKGFALSRFARRQVHVMSERAVLLGGAFDRLRADGSLIESVCCTYLLARRDAGWQLATTVVHTPERLLPPRAASATDDAAR
jgi:ketosteroid isomerase-like protein